MARMEGQGEAATSFEAEALASRAWRNSKAASVLYCLGAFDGDFLHKNQVSLAGGAAVALHYGMFRETYGLDFVTSSLPGYHALRRYVSEISLGDAFKGAARVSFGFLQGYEPALFHGLLDFRGEYDIANPIRFRFMFEPRMNVRGELLSHSPVPVLSEVDLFAAKLLSNQDRLFGSRRDLVDVIDLAVMISSAGKIPPEAWEKALAADPRVADGFREMAALASNNGVLDGALGGRRLPHRKTIPQGMVRCALASELVRMPK